MNPYLSIVIPAYNESENFRAGILDPVISFLKSQKYSWEILFVDDGSTDDTFKLLSGLTKKNKNIKVLKITHGGKAAAVTAGVLAAKGKIILLTDFDQSTPLYQVKTFIEAHKNGADIVTGVRIKTENDTLIRKIRSWAYITLVRLVILPELKDSQCGFKSFTNPAAKKIFTSLLVSLPKGEIVGAYMGAWEVEVFFLAKKFGFRVDQVPVKWIKYLSNRLNVWRDPLLMARDTLKVRLWDILGRYNAV